ncbi:MAG TPA: diguanylate cyclase [Bryobacteraceae bacterium]|nr:diguanylate cyclase [Bryobacteraceae bacterium]
MISLRKTATELDRLEEFHRTAVNCYSQALHSSGQYAVELDAAEAARFREQLEALRDKLQAEADARQLEAVHSSFEAELKEYGDKTRAQIQRLRKDIEAAAAAVETFAGSVNESEVQLESGLKRELQTLKKSAASEDIREMRGAIESAAAKIGASVEQMRASNQLAIAQLKDEIRLLHQEVRTARAQADPAIENRQVDRKIDELIRKNTPFSVLLVVVRNFDGLKNCFSAIVIASAVRNFQARFESILPSGAMVGRWGKDQFAAVLGTPPANAMDMSSDVVRKLSAPFLEEEKGISQSVLFTPRAGVIEYRPGLDPAKFQIKLKQLAETLAQ